jgi:hypothetical protein
MSNGTNANVAENPLDISSSTKNVDNVDVIKNIVSTETSEGEEQLLEKAPELDLSLMQDIAPPKSPILILLKTFFGLLVVFGSASLIFFTSQLTDKLAFMNTTFGLPNVANELQSTNSEITKLQTNFNLYRQLQIKAHLDEFSYFGDSYVQSYNIANGKTSENSAIKKASDEISYLRGELSESFSKIKELLVYDSTAPLASSDLKSDDELKFIFENELRAELNLKANELLNNTDEQAKMDYKNYLHAINLVGNTQIKDLFLQTDFDLLSDKELFDFIKTVNSQIVNDLSIIQTIKENRIAWSDIMNEIYLRTISVDAYYSGDYYNELGGIQYTSYDFDSEKRSISIVGETKRFDTTVFTMIVNLIEELNRSDIFENAEMKSFSKSGSLDSGYTSSIRLNLTLTK